MAGKIKLGSLIICDEMRSETSGKDILIGVYRGIIVVPSVPMMMRQLAFRLPVFADQSIDGEFSLEVRGPDKNSLFKANGPGRLDPSDQGFEATFGIMIGPFQLAVYGIHDVRFSCPGIKPKVVGRFLVRAPKPGDPTFAQVLPVG
jgi:hypothetical protein